MVPLQPIITSYPNERWVIDLKYVGLDPETGHCQLWVCIDAFSGYCWTKPLYAKTGEETALALYNVVANEGIPETLGMDNGPEFLNEVDAQLYLMFQLKIARGTPLHPQSQGKVERVHQVVGNKLVNYANTHNGQWTHLLESVTYKANTSPSEPLGPGLTPFYVYKGRWPVVQRDGVTTVRRTARDPVLCPETRRELNTKVHASIVARGLREVANHSKRQRVELPMFPVGTVVKVKAPEDHRHGQLWRVKGVVERVDAQFYKYDVRLLDVGYAANQEIGTVMENVSHARVNFVAPSLEVATAQGLAQPPVSPSEEDMQNELLARARYRVDFVFGQKTLQSKTWYFTKWADHPWTACTWQTYESFTPDVQRALAKYTFYDYTKELKTPKKNEDYLVSLEGVFVKAGPTYYVTVLLTPVALQKLDILC